MRWLTILETQAEMRTRLAGCTTDEILNAHPEPVATGIELARTATSVLVWVPVLVGKRIKPGGQAMTMPWRQGHVPVIEATLNIVRDATPEEIAAAGGERDGA